jgi:hypothetical protein
VPPHEHRTVELKNIHLIAQKQPYNPEYTGCVSRAHSKLPNDRCRTQPRGLDFGNGQSQIKCPVGRHLAVQNASLVRIMALAKIMIDRHQWVINQSPARSLDHQANHHIIVDLRSYAAQPGVESNGSDGVQAEGTVRSFQNIDLSRIPVPKMVISHDTPEPLNPAQYFSLALLNNTFIV